jgi:uncharacterized protein YdhG (YjbR/CyaY superfamily)
MSAAAKASGKRKDEEPSSGRFSAEERAAMKERAAELKAQGRRASAEEKAAADEAAVRSRIAEMPQPDRTMAERLHTIVTDAAPELLPKLYYGQPGWAKAGKVIVFFRSGLMDKARYSTLGFSVHAGLDEKGGLWPTSFALEQLTDVSAKTITKFVKKAVS